MAEGPVPDPVVLFFDPGWYQGRYPDVAEQVPLDHFLRHGMAEGRDPGPGFDSAAYLREYPDVGNAGLVAFTHFVDVGHREGRRALPGLPESPRARVVPRELADLYSILMWRNRVEAVSEASD